MDISNEHHFIISIERFLPHTFQAELGEGLFLSHAHEYDEITLVLEGEGFYSSTDQNVKVMAGHLIQIPPGLHHGFVCTKPWRGISVHFSHQKLPVFCQYPFHQTDQKPERIQAARLAGDELRWAEMSLGQLEKHWHASKPNVDSFNLMRIAFETILLLFQHNQAPAAAADDTPGDHNVVQKVLKEIHASYYTSVTISELAARHFLSESNLRKKFSETLGISPKQYIINLRLMEAKRLLQLSNKAIDLIASEVGFTSSSRFYDLFVKAEGVTPLEWRKQHQ